MSLKTAPIAQGPFFYAAGNTPAVCLTQSFPPEQDAALLLLGCGDIRNILFTVYGGVGSDGRNLDFTCCDLEAETIARNVLMLSLILDDTKGVLTQQVWNVYYHVFIDAESMTLLQGQAKKLLDYAASPAIWHSSPYGQIIRFCDSTTLRNVVNLWKLYAIDQSDQQRYKKVQRNIKAQWEAAKRYKKTRMSSNSSVPDGPHVVAPMLLAGLSETTKQHQTYWASGTCLENRNVIRKLTIANPMFICRRSGLLLHYGNDPLRGFHFSVLYTRLAAGLSMKLSDISAGSFNTLPKGMMIALAQLASWCRAFRDAATKVTIRYVNSDAIAFCYALRHHRSHGESQSSHWYRANWKFDSLVFDTADYKVGGYAPTTFDVIDTSNLIDHLGSLNLLVATVPLLSSKPLSTLRTEMLLPQESNVTGSAKTLLCGDLPTMAFLLGLKPTQYWTNATATWSPNDSFLENVPEGETVSQNRVLSRQIILWKTASCCHLRYDAVELANFMFNLYLEMFKGEDTARLLKLLTDGNAHVLLKKLLCLELYTRASLAVILRHVREAEVVEWRPFIKHLTKMILADRTLSMGLHHFQSLLVHLDLFGISAIPQYSNFQQDLASGPFRKWKSMPTVVCLTLVVPRAAVAAFKNIYNGHGTPLCYLQTLSSTSMGQSNYADVQLGFGTIAASGISYTSNYTINVQDDDAGCNGKSPLIVSAMVSTASLTQHGDSSCGVGLFLNSTQANVAKLASRFGPFLQLYKSSVGKEDVFVTKHRPNMTGHVSVQCTSSPVEEDSKSVLESSMRIREPRLTCLDTDVAIQIRPVFDAAATKIVSLQTRYDIKSPVTRVLLQNAAAVNFELLNPFTLVLNIDDKCWKELELPLPLDSDYGKTRIAAKSSWVEYTASIAEPERLALRADSMFPVERSYG